VQAVGDAHDTADRLLFLAPAGLGVGWIDQLAPSQCSTKDRDGPLGGSTGDWEGPLGGLLLPVPLTQPTAVQEFGDAQDTAINWPIKPGVGWIDQRAPSQCSTSGAILPLLETKLDPTAVQAVDEAHDTPHRLLFVPRAAADVGWVDQWRPFHRSIAWLTPTAVHALGDVHDTDSR
jgi:hypothetical protein